MDNDDEKVIREKLKGSLEVLICREKKKIAFSRNKDK